MDEKLVKQRLDKAKEKVTKLENTLSKYLIRMQKLYERYSKAKHLHTIVPFDTFIKFDTETYYTWKEELAYEEELGKEFSNVSIYVRGSFIQNKAASKEFMANINKDDVKKLDVVKQVRDFLYNAENLAQTIVNKRREIAEAKKHVDNYEKILNGIRQTQNKVEQLFEKIPTLKTFIDECGEKQYNYLVEYNKKLAEKWETYYKLDDECSKLWNSGVHGEAFKKEWQKALKAKPKNRPKTPMQIAEDVEHWKKMEGEIMAERLKTEFGEIINTNLYLGEDGNVNGIIHGTIKTGWIETIFAGGYNIQKLHTRLLFHEKDS